MLADRAGLVYACLTGRAGLLLSSPAWEALGPAVDRCRRRGKWGACGSLALAWQFAAQSRTAPFADAAHMSPSGVPLAPEGELD